MKNFIILLFIVSGWSVSTAQTDTASVTPVKKVLEGVRSNPILRFRNLELDLDADCGEELLTLDKTGIREQFEILNKRFSQPDVQKSEYYLELYKHDFKDASALMLGIGRDYLPVIQSIITEAGLPSELSYLPLVLSGLNPVYSKSDGGAGIWQLKTQTAIRFGLEVNAYEDERLDIRKSTRAACKYLADLYGIYRNWPLTVTAYSGSPAIVNSAGIRCGNSTEYKNIYPCLDAAYRDVYPAFSAMVILGENYQKQNAYTLLPSAIQYSEIVQTSSEVHLGQISDVLNIPMHLLKELNPVYTKNIVPAKKMLQLPAGKAEIYKNKEVDICAFQDSVYFPKTTGIYVQQSGIVPVNQNQTATTVTIKKYHKVRKGETLSKIAAKYHVSKSNLRKWNNLNSDKLKAGRKLIIQIQQKERISTSEDSKIRENNGVQEAEPDIRVDSAAIRNNLPPVRPVNPPSQIQWIYHTVKSGETLSAIGQKYRISYQKIKDWNGLRSDQIRAGQKLKIKKAS